MDKLHKTLVLMLRASVPAEVVAARDALLRIAETGKLDAHDLAAAILVSLKNGSLDKAPINEMAKSIWKWWVDGGGQLSDREQKFVGDMMNYGRAPSEKQAAWLKSIYARVR
jgi:hypothetical protein